VKHLVLVGLMGAGKTTVGERCARRLGRSFVDTDALVQTLTGHTVVELFDRFGESRFRAEERRAVEDVCASPEPLVISCGGGAVLDSENRTRLRTTGFVVWLTASPETLALRVGRGDERPLLRASPASTLARLAEARDEMYAAVAHARVDTESRSASEVADAVVEEYARCSG